MLGRSSSLTEPEIMTYINGLSNRTAKVDASACVLKVCSSSCFPPPLRAAQPWCLEFKSVGITFFYLTIDAIPKPHHSSPLVIFVPPTLTKPNILGEHGHTGKNLKALG